MDWKDLKTCEKTLRSYRAALKQALQICPHIETPNTWGHAAPLELSPSFGTKQDALIIHATGVIVSHVELLSWGRLSHNGTTLNYDFFSVTPYVDIPFSVYGWEAGRRHAVDETTGKQPKDTPPRISAHAQHLRLIGWGHAPIKYGALKFREQKVEIAKLFGKCRDSSVRDRYTEGFNRACAAITQWETALAKESEAAKALLKI